MTRHQKWCRTLNLQAPFLVQKAASLLTEDLARENCRPLRLILPFKYTLMHVMMLLLEAEQENRL